MNILHMFMSKVEKSETNAWFIRLKTFFLLMLDLPHACNAHRCPNLQVFQLISFSFFISIRCSTNCMKTRDNKQSLFSKYWRLLPRATSLQLVSKSTHIFIVNNRLTPDFRSNTPKLLEYVWRGIKKEQLHEMRHQ